MMIGTNAKSGIVMIVISGLGNKCGFSFNGLHPKQMSGNVPAES